MTLTELVIMLDKPKKSTLRKNNIRKNDTGNLSGDEILEYRKKLSDENYMHNAVEVIAEKIIGGCLDEIHKKNKKPKQRR